MRWDGPIRRGPGGRRHASCRDESSAGLLWRISGPGRVHARFLVPYCTLASCGGGAHYWARSDERLTRRASLCRALAFIAAAAPQRWQPSPADPAPSRSGGGARARQAIRA